MGPYCNFCGRRCFAHFPVETPGHVLDAYGTSTIIATCPGGQKFEREKVGYCHDNIQRMIQKGGHHLSAQSPDAPTYEPPSDDDLAAEFEASVETLLHDARELPVVTNVHEYGATTERVKLMLASLGFYIGELKEHASALKEIHAREVRGDKATLNDKDKIEMMRRYSEDAGLRSLGSKIARLQEAWTRWDARRSRLNRDFEIAKIDYAKQQGQWLLEQLGLRLTHAADYAANRIRNAV